MKKPTKQNHRGLTGRALQFLVLHMNERGEISASLEVALLLAGPKASITNIPAKTLAEYNIEGSALLIRGRKTIVWSACGTLATVAELAKAYSADIAANWIAHLASEHYATLDPAGAHTKKASQ